MTRRVDLDLLEQDAMTTPPQDAPPVSGTEPGQALEVRVSLRFRFRNLLRNTVGRFKRPDVPFNWKSLLSWKVLVPAGAAVALLVSASVGYVLFQKQETVRVAAEQKNQAASAVPVVREAVFADFSIDLKDAQGRYRFLQCDVTLEFQSEVTLTEDRKVEIRKIIYMSAKKKGPELIRVSNSGERFKKEMRDELRDLLGEGALKDIYITRYVLI
jgi:flagellar basal body-associated protein FliL